MAAFSWVIAILAGILIAAVFALLYHLIQQNGRVLLRLEALERQLREQGIPIADGENPLPVGMTAGTMLNDFSLPSLSGETMRLSQWKGRRLLLIFFHPECSFCRGFLESLGAWLKTGAAPGLTPLFVSRGGAEQNRRLFEEHGIRFPVLLQEDAEVASLFRIPGTPVGYVVDERGATASEMLVGEDPLLRALGAPAATPRAAGKVSRSVAESKLVRDGLKAGTPAPDFTLPSLDGSELSLKDYRGRKVLLVFSDPECQPCSRMAPDLERIHRQANGLQVLMVSRGDIEANRRKAAEQRLTFPIVLQRHWEISRAYGMFATPIAYLVDEGGVISKDVAVGAEPILKLST
jgi:peroxiredoxin